MPVRVSVVVLAAALGLCSARAADVDDVKEKLFQAKKEYDGEVRKFRAAVTEALDKREEAARKAGDRKAVEAAKAERDRFDKSGELPPTTPAAAVTQVRAARTALDKAYTAAVKDYLRLKEDAAAEAAEKEQQKFALDSTLQFGKRTYLVSLKHTDLRVENPTGFSNNGADPNSGIKLKLNGEPVPHSIFLVPPPKGHSEVSYVITGKGTAFRTVVGVTRIGEDAGDPGTPLTFEVLGDGKPLWKSKPVAKLDMYETCELKLDKVRKLTLRVICPGPNTLARAMWYEPIIAE